MQLSMDKRAPLRQYFDDKANEAKSEKQYAERTAQLDALETTVVKAFNSLIRYMDGTTTKTEVVNQLKSISTPDVDKVVQAVSKLDADVLANRLDLKPLEAILSSVKREVSLIPKTHAKFEQKEAVKVTNLDEVKFDTSELEKAIKGLKLNPTIDVKAPIVNVDKPDLKPLQDVMLDLLKAVQGQKFPDFPEIPVTDLSKVEKKLDESNKHLKTISEKKFGGGGGGGGGNGTPYVDDVGTPKNVVLIDGSIPVQSVGGATEEQQVVQGEVLEEIEHAVQSIASAKGVAGDIRVTILSGTVTTVSTLSNQSSMGGWTASSLVPATSNTTAVLSNINNVGV